MGLPDPLYTSADGTSWYDQEALDRYRTHPKCAFPGCPEHVWYHNTHMDAAFPEPYRKYCFTCAFWEQRTDDYKDFDSLRAWIVVRTRTNLDMYSYDKQDPIAEGKKGFLGHGGRVWRIEYVDSDKVVVTNNLWHSGEIPERFQERFPVNARLMTVDPKWRDITTQTSPYLS